MKHLNMKRLILILIAFTVSGWGGVQLGGGVEAAGGGPAGPSLTLDDAFAANNTDWSCRNGATLNTWAGGELSTSDSGACIYDEDTDTGGHGNLPLTADHWIVAEVGTVTQDNIGFGVRVLKATPGPSDYNYVMRCTGAVLAFRKCHSDSNCVDLHSVPTTETCTAATGDQYALMVAGTGTSTELCGWYWAAADDEPTTWSDPGDWGEADICMGGPATMTLLADYVGAGTTESAWDSAPIAPRGYSNTNNGVTLYIGQVGEIEWAWMMAGDLGL